MTVEAFERRAYIRKKESEKAMRDFKTMRPDLVRRCERLRKARVELAAAEAEIGDLVRVVGELRTFGLAQGTIAQLMGYSRRQIIRFCHEWEARLD